MRRRTLVTLKSLEMATGRRVSARARSSCLHILIDDHRMWLSRLHIHIHNIWIIKVKPSFGYINTALTAWAADSHEVSHTYNETIDEQM